MESRRSFFRQLVAGGATVTADLRGKALKHRKSDKQQNVRVYHGPMVIPGDVAEIVREDPALKRTRARHLVSRYADDGVTWLFRCQVPESRQMVGDVQLQPDGGYRVVCWSAARPGEYRGARELIAAQTQQQEPSTPILPPMSPPAPEWTPEYYDPLCPADSLLWPGRGDVK